MFACFLFLKSLFTPPNNCSWQRSIITVAFSTVRPSMRRRIVFNDGRKVIQSVCSCASFVAQNTWTRICLVIWLLIWTHMENQQWETFEIGLARPTCGFRKRVSKMMFVRVERQAFSEKSVENNFILQHPSFCGIHWIRLASNIQRGTT